MAVPIRNEGRMLGSLSMRFPHSAMSEDEAARRFGPRLVQAEDDAPRIGRLHRRHLVLDEARGVAAIALEGELHVLGRHRLAVVELHAGA